MRTEVTLGVGSGSDGVLQRLAGRDHFSAVIVAAMAANVVWTLQFAAIVALRVRFNRQSLMAAPHAPAGRRRLTFWNSHGTRSFLTARCV
jgi:hypothetical protein